MADNPQKIVAQAELDASQTVRGARDAAHALTEVIAKAGEPKAKLVPYSAPGKPRRKPGGLRLTGDIPDSVWFDPLPEDELELWEGKRLEKYGL